MYNLQRWLSCVFVSFTCYHQHLSTGEFNQEQKGYILRTHNEYRSKAGASDMNELEWNKSLEEVAQIWAEGCIDGHGQPNDYRLPNGKKPGQNLYFRSGPSNPINAVRIWYHERRAYDYDTRTCRANLLCGHYLQLIWSTVTSLGCAYTVCPIMYNPDGQPKINRNFTYVVCNYDRMRLIGAHPFTKGTPCSRCHSGSFFCNNSLCQKSCSPEDTSCECKAESVCKNCATIQRENCTCKCSKGFYGGSCDTQCEDKEKVCPSNYAKDPDWFCNPDNYFDQQEVERVQRDCLRTCANFSGLCIPLAANETAPLVCPASTPEPESSTKAIGSNTTMSSQVPCRRSCVHGKASLEQSGTCACHCSEKWQGAECKENTDQALHGIYVILLARQGKWACIKNVLETEISRAVIEACSKREVDAPSCPFKDSNKNSQTSENVTVHIGDGYPEFDMEVYTIKVLVYTSIDEEPGSQTPFVYISGEVLRRSVDSNMAALSSKLADRCGVTIKSIDTAKVRDETDRGGGLASWKVAVIILAHIIIIIAIIAIIIFIARRSSKNANQGTNAYLVHIVKNTDT